MKALISLLATLAILIALIIALFPIGVRCSGGGEGSESGDDQSFVFLSL